MAKEIKTITSDWVDSISKLKIKEKARIPDSGYDCVMSSARYRLKRKGVEIKRDGEKYFIGKELFFNIKRIS
ncbi:hypothetical protein [Bacteroides finegoldii]|uniref:hypothetical protein n=1 Tax=Bacteroides finegoldii TaxID=338188 RepID=UPI00265D0D06|nr:hypothetical protein [Bacteroides finegoldii]